MSFLFKILLAIPDNIVSSDIILFELSFSFKFSFLFSVYVPIPPVHIGLFFGCSRCAEPIVGKGGAGERGERSKWENLYITKKQNKNKTQLAS